MQRRRRSNPYPHTWEVPLAVMVGFSVLLVLGVHLGRAVANLIAGSGWVFVERAGLFTSLPGVLAGRADAGLVGIESPAVAGLLWGSVLFVEVLVLVASGVCLKLGRERWGPSRIQGTATRAEALELLGTVRLRKHAALIRPDLSSGQSRHGGLAGQPRQSVRIAGSEGMRS